MEYMERGSLYHVLNKGPLTADQQKQVALDIARGLYYLHSQKVLHKDLKSGNILINNHGQAKISDFGLSKVTFASVRSIQKQTGDLEWQAPEAIQGTGYTEASDIYSFGVILWELFTRKKPFANLSGMALMDAIIAGKREAIPKDMPTEMQTIITSCWDKEPTKRPYVSTLIRDLESYQPRPPSPTPEAYYNQGIVAEKNKDYATAIPFYQKAAAKGYPRAKTNLGWIALKGLDGQSHGHARALRFFVEGAEGGHIRAMYNLGLMFETGDGVAIDLHKSLSWYRKAAEKGDKESEQKVIELSQQLTGARDYNKNPMRPN